MKKLSGTLAQKLKLSDDSCVDSLWPASMYKWFVSAERMLRTTERGCLIDLKQGKSSLKMFQDLFYPRGLILNFVTPAPNPLAFWPPARVQVSDVWLYVDVAAHVFVCFLP